MPERDLTFFYFLPHALSVEEELKQKRAYATGWVERAAPGEQSDWLAPLLFTGCLTKHLQLFLTPAKRPKKYVQPHPLLGIFMEESKVIG